MKIVKIFQIETVLFTAVKCRCLLHGRVFVTIVFMKRETVKRHCLKIGFKHAN